MSRRFIPILTLVAGIVGGSALPHWLATPAFAQSATAMPGAAPIRTMAPMPMHSTAPIMPKSGMMGGCPMMHGMMSASKSRADRAYMGAMLEMHGAMMRHPMTGNTDHDFLVMMIPHHEAAVQMAKTELRYGKDARVRALAKGIITAQNHEITEMRAWLK